MANKPPTIATIAAERPFATKEEAAAEAVAVGAVDELLAWEPVDDATEVDEAVEPVDVVLEIAAIGKEEEEKKDPIICQIEAWSRNNKKTYHIQLVVMSEQLGYHSLCNSLANKQRRLAGMQKRCTHTLDSR